jgi:hypothetical protein
MESLQIDKKVIKTLTRLGLVAVCRPASEGSASWGNGMAQTQRESRQSTTDFDIDVAIVGGVSGVYSAWRLLSAERSQFGPALQSLANRRAERYGIHRRVTPSQRLAGAAQLWPV